MSKIICSIIVPVYNVEKYLKHCLNSLIQSVDDESEIILVLGASTDKSNEICKNYAKMHSNIILLYQDGTGLSNARNCGLKIAKGTYISFIDSDDYVSIREYRSLIEFLKNPSTENFDVLLMDFVEVFHNGAMLKPIDTLIDYTSPKIVTDDEISIFLSKRNCFWNVWRYIYRRNFLLQNNIWFLENQTAEDVDFTNKVFINQKSILFWHNPYYFYRKNRENSLMDIVTEKRIKDITSILEKSIDDVSVSKCVYRNCLIHQYQIEYFLNIALLAEIKSKDCKTYYRNWRNILVDCRGFGLKIGVICINIFGLNITANILYSLKKIRRFKRIMKIKN